MCVGRLSSTDSSVSCKYNIKNQLFALKTELMKLSFNFVDV